MFYHRCVSKLIPPPKDGKPLRMIAGKYEWSGAREVGDCSVRIVRADINYDDGELVRWSAKCLIKRGLRETYSYFTFSTLVD